MVARKTPSIPPVWQVWGIVLGITLSVTTLVSQGVYPTFDVQLSRGLQSLRTEQLEPLSQALYEFGMNPVYPLVALSAAGWLVFNRRYLPSSFVLLAFASRALVTVIKEVVERPRPTAAEIGLIEGASGFSFPSGHVLGTFLLVGAIWFVFMEWTESRLVRRLLTILASVWVLLMGLQRVYAGAHWTSDVIGGYLWGGLILFLLVQLYRLAESKLRNPNRAMGYELPPRSS